MILTTPVWAAIYAPTGTLAKAGKDLSGQIDLGKKTRFYCLLLFFFLSGDKIYMPALAATLEAISLGGSNGKIFSKRTVASTFFTVLTPVSFSPSILQ